MIKISLLSLLCLLVASPGQVMSFLATQRVSPQKSQCPKDHFFMSKQPHESNDSLSTTRRNWIGGAGLATITALISKAAPVAAAESIPAISVTQFQTILTDSASSISRVEFTGPKNEIVIVRLIDGSIFGLKDVIESPVDPRSPLKVQALCREAGVPVRFPDLEAILATAPKKKKMYTNERVLEANEKEKERQLRVQQDEEARLAALYKQQEEEARLLLEKEQKAAAPAATSE